MNSILYLKNAQEAYINLDFPGSYEETIRKVRLAVNKYFENNRDKLGYSYPSVVAVYPDAVIIQLDTEKGSTSSYQIGYGVENGEIKLGDFTPIDIVPTIVAKQKQMFDLGQQTIGSTATSKDAKEGLALIKSMFFIELIKG